MKTLLYITWVVTLLSCSKANLNNICNVDDPITELSWLATKIANQEADIVSKVILKKEKKIEAFSITDGSSYGYYNCIGEILYLSIGINPTPNPYKEIKSEEIYRK